MKKENCVLHLKADPVIRTLSELPDIKGIVCYGSYALGTFDECSDVDLYVFCQTEIIPPHARQNAFRKMEGMSDLTPDHIEFGWDNQWSPQGDRFRVGGVLFDVTFNTLDWIHTVVRRVIEEGATSIPEPRFRPYTMLGEIKSSLFPYPARLKKILIARSLCTIKGSLDDLHDYVKRGIGNTAFLFHLERIIDSLGELLFALNERYNMATKRVEEALRELKILPDNFLHRYRALLETPLTVDGRKKVARELQVLTEEIEILVNEKAKQDSRNVLCKQCSL